MGTPIYLNEGALAKLEFNTTGQSLPALRTLPRRAFRLHADGFEYTFEIRRKELGVPFAEPMPTGQPSLQDCAEIIAYLFGRLMSPLEAAASPAPVAFDPKGKNVFVTGGNPNALRSDSQRRWIAGDFSEREDGPGPDMERGWKAYKRNLAETAACVVPEWKDLPYEVQECFASAVYAAWEAGEEADSELRWGVVGEEAQDSRIQNQEVIRRYDERRRRCASCLGSGCRLCQVEGGAR